MLDIPVIDILGWIGASLSLAAASMRTMLPLRLAAVGASLFFILYGFLAGAWPVMALFAALLPFNLFRLWQLRRADRAAKQVMEGDFSLDWIMHAVRPIRFDDGEVVFRKGEAPHYMYYLKSGRVVLEETDTTLESGAIFGEIAFFTDAHERTLTARCAGPCEIMVIRDQDLARLHFQNPAFGLYLLRLVANRLTEGIEQNPEAYRPVRAQPAVSPFDDIRFPFKVG